MNSPEIAEYLSRIKHEACLLNLEGLTTLQSHHLENIPFENLDIVVRREIALDYAHLFDKVITKKRGGYCFELNTLYALLLKALGFSPKPVLGRVWLSNPKNTPPRNHLAHLVELNGKTYVTDVGFGGLMTRIPLDINVSIPVKDQDGFVRILKLDDTQFMIQRQIEDIWTNQYSFENVDISEEDISISNYYMSTNPKSIFYNHKCVGMYTKEGRVGVFNNKISFRKGIKIVDKRPMLYGKEWLEAISMEFSLNLDFTEEEFRSLFENRMKG